MTGPIPVLVLFGPTASGKTALLEELFAKRGLEAPRFKASVVSADSMQVYRGMDIGTAKPSAELLAALPHRLIDIRDPGDAFNVGDFVRLADEACLEFHARGLLPVVAGGTGFYLKHFVLGLAETPPSDPALRAVLQAELVSRGAEALHGELSRIDPAAAARIHVHDEYRLCRALEVFRASGRPLSSFSPASSAGRPSYRFLCLSLERDREELYRRIDERARAMFAAGLPDEVARLRAAGWGADAPGMRAIGYREFFEADGAGEEIILDAVARNSRRYAKRQITFASSIPGLLRLDAASPGIAERVAGLLDAFLVGS